MSRLSIDDEGFTLTAESGELVGRVDWTSLERVTAIQWQNMEPDELCLDYEIESNIITVSEYDEGFEELVGAMLMNLDLEDPNWFSEAIKPAIQLKPILVYDREAGY